MYYYSERETIYTMDADVLKINGYTSGYELITHIDEKDWNIILRRESPNTNIAVPNLHKHLYAEIIMLENGILNYQVGDHQYTIKTNELLVIPSLVFHKPISMEAKSANMITIQIDYDFPEPITYSCNPGIFTELMQELQKTYQTGYCGKSSAYLAQILSPLLCSNRQKLVPLQDRRYIIHEYLSNHYAEDISLKDVANELNLSEKQTARLITKYTGNPFRRELPRKRIEAAQYLQQTTDLSMEEIAAQVGYCSYSSYWKALRNQF